MPNNLAASQSLTPWPSTVPGALQWRRVKRLRGKMPVEVAAGDAVFGRLVPTDFWGKQYQAGTEGAGWRFIARGFWRRRCIAYPAGEWGPEAVGAPEVLAESARAGFRRRQVQIGDGPVLDWRQLGVDGSRYRLAVPDSGPELLSVRNTGGSLRWRGTIEVCEPARALGPELPLIVLFSLFLVFNSGELGL